MSDNEKVTPTIDTNIMNPNENAQDEQSNEIQKNPSNNLPEGKANGEETTGNQLLGITKSQIDTDNVFNLKKTRSCGCSIF